MTAHPLSFFTIDHGTASTAAALIAPLDGTFRLLAFDVVPAGVPVETLLEDLVGRVTALEPDALPGAGSWTDWARLESGTYEPRSIVLAATTEGAMTDLDNAVRGAGWDIRARSIAGRGDLTWVVEACLDPAITAIAVAAPDGTGDETQRQPQIAQLMAAMASRRDDLWVLLAGGASSLARSMPVGRTVTAELGQSAGPAGVSRLRRAVMELARRGVGATSHPDGREALRVSIGTLSRLLDRRVEAVDIGYSSGTRTMAFPDGSSWHLTEADAALVPAGAMRDDHDAEWILRWSALRSDPGTLVDRIRNLRIAPWRDQTGDGPRIRLAALRAALARLQASWHGVPHSAPQPSARELAQGAMRSPRGHPAPAPDGPVELLIACGGAFAALPAPAAALALVDTLRRPGAMAVFHDHARLLGPVGTLVEESDRRRLLADLLDDVLLPLGSAVVTGELRASRHPGRMRISSPLRSSELELAGGSLRLLDLPPGVPAHLEIESNDGMLLGLRARRVALEVTGGLGGLLLDTREVPLRLPDRPERRRELFEAWERPIWASVSG